jgi:hypothetical protein
MEKVISKNGSRQIIQGYFPENKDVDVLMEETTPVSRVELIGPDGRIVALYGSFEFLIQDGGKTVKIIKKS